MTVSEKACLITGLSGAGKSSLTRVMRLEGYNAFDADELPELGQWVDNESGLSSPTYHADRDWRAKHRYLWDLERLPGIIARCRADSPPGPVFIAGIAGNLTDSFPHFTHHVFLRADADVLARHLAAPDRVTPYPYECDDAYMQSLERVVPMIERDMAAIGALAVDAMLPSEDISRIVVGYVENT